jgi:biofilm PGA synthesis N-glycosyltransferase PgaC
VLLVDDGSSDRTFERARRFAGRHGGCQVRVYRKPNGGKWSAHNFLFHRSTAELLLCVDADSRLSPDALRRLVERMADPGVSAVAGYVRVRNRVNGLTCLQTLEYLWSGLLRLAQSASSSVLVVPGPIGLFRRAVLEEVYLNFGLGAEGTGPGEVRGPFEGTTFAEDFDLSAAILTLGGCIVYEPRAVSHTTLPASTAALLNQRYRWVRGSLQTVIKYFRRARADSRHANPSVTVWILATYVLDVVSLLFYLGALGALLAFLGRGGDPSPLLFWFVGLLALDFSTQAYLIALLQERYALLAVLPLYGLYQALLLNSALIIGCLDEIRGSRMRW